MNQTLRLPGSSSNRKWWILGIISVSLFMILLDVTIVNIALPAIMNDFKINLASVEWIMNVYVLVFAALLLTLGKLGDLFGRKRLFMIGLAIFTLASLGCSLSPNLAVLLVSRGIQAIGAAAMMPATLSIVNVEFEKSQRGLALGIWGAVAGGANAMGPIIGGSLVDAFSWPWIFVINVPVGILALFATWKVVGESVDTRADRHIDIPGVSIISLALFCLTFALVEGQTYGWTSATILGLFAGALIGLVFFIFIELRTASPLAQLRLFRNRSFTSGNIVGMVINFGMIGLIFLLVLYLQLVLKINAFTTGLWLLPFPLAVIIVAPLAGRLTDKIGGRWILFIGSLLTALGFYLMIDIDRIAVWTDLLLPLGICGAGIGMVMAPVTTVIMASTPTQQSGMGAGILSTIRQIGAVMGLSVLGAVLQNQLVSNITQALSKIPNIPDAIRSRITEGLAGGNISAGMSMSGNIPASMQTQFMEMFKTQFAISLGTAMKVGIIVIIIGAVASLFIASHIHRKETGTDKPPIA
jgi:EmrB/QacA subfamily drug resistance transporter